MTRRAGQPEPTQPSPEPTRADPEPARPLGPVTRDDAVRGAGEVVAHAYHRLEELTPREAAQAAYTPTGPPVEELEARIRARRGLPPREAAS